MLSIWTADQFYQICNLVLSEYNHNRQFTYQIVRVDEIKSHKNYLNIPSVVGRYKRYVFHCVCIVKKVTKKTQK